ncbi:hypothetical protein ABC502_08680 [Alkalimonas sp. NCh-2]|uniref:YobI family P-loop NTPase n=1 Tax=Alkalimonas sp. NCh-2 TaxID=3144846 RepID=UPI0031F6E4F6
MTNTLKRTVTNIKVLIVVILTATNRAISNWLFILQPEISSEKKTEDFLPLTPTLLDFDDIQEYERQLNNALQGKSCKKITNIAITGSYAVGKSSFLRTFIYHNPMYQDSPVISMAKFSTNEVEEDKNIDEELTQDPSHPDVKSSAETRRHFREQVEIEKSILEQLLYSANPKKLSLSSFRRLKEPSVFLTPSLFLLVISALMLMPTVWQNIASTLPEWIPLSLIPQWLAYIYIIFFTLCTLPWLIKIIRGYSITKFSIQGVDFERQSHRSFLRENIDEFIYFFDKTKVQLVIFEDIDRLEATHAMTILTHIREVNRIVNLSRTVPVFFIYAVKDDLFKADDRTKFFDLIIPIIPVINSNNAYEKLTAALDLKPENNCIHKALSINLVKDVSLFFGDLRMIYNLANEYKLYKSKLAKNHPLDLNKLFAMLVIKTLHPSVYTQLLINKGPINQVIELADIARNALKEDINKQKHKITEKINQKKDLIAKSKHDLLALFWVYCVKKSGLNPFPTGIKIGSDITHIPAVFETDSAFEKFMLGTLEQKAMVVNYRSHDVGYFESPLNIKNNFDLNYAQCLDLIELDETAMDRELSELNQKLKKISDYQLKDLMQEASARYVLLEPLKENYRVIKFLLSHGHIGEDYADYTSFFYPGAITLADKVKLQRIKMLEKLPRSTPFDKPSEVIEQLQPADLTDGRGLISGLFPELVKPRNKAKLRSALSDSSPFADDIIVLWRNLKGGRQRITFLTTLLESDFYNTVSIIKLIDDSPEYHDGVVRQYIKDLLGDLSNNAHLKLKDSEPFCKVVSGLKTLDDLEDLQCEWFWSSTNIQYYQLEHVSEGIASKIMQSGQFRFSASTMTALLQHSFEHGDNTSLLSYQSILSTKHEAFIDHINDDIVEFISFLEKNDSWQESYSSAIALFNKEDLHEETKLKIAKSTGATFKCNDIPDACLLEFIRHDLISASLDEIEIAHSEFDLIENTDPVEVDKAFAEFVERNIETLISNIGTETSTNFLSYLLMLDITNEAFIRLAGMYTLNEDFLKKLQLTDERWQLLAGISKLTFNKETFMFIQSKSESAAAKFIMRKWPSHYDHLNKEAKILPGTIITMLSSDNIEIKEKLKLYEAHKSINFSATGSLADSLVDKALKHDLSLPPIDSSLISQLKLSDKSELRAKAALYYISNSNGGFTEVCELLSLFKVLGLESFSDKPRTVSVSNTQVMKTILSKLQFFGYIGTIRGDASEKLIGYLKTSMCVD